MTANRCERQGKFEQRVVTFLAVILISIGALAQTDPNGDLGPDLGQVRTVTAAAAKQIQMGGSSGAGGGVVYKLFSTLMANHVFWIDHPALFRELNDLMGISSYLYSTVNFRRQLYYVPKADKQPAYWRVVDSFSPQVFTYFPNLLELFPRANETNGANYFNHEFYFFVNGGINKSDDFITVRAIPIPDGKSSALALAEALVQPPLWRFKTKLTLTSLKNSLAFLLTGLDVKYMRDVMQENDIIVFPSTYGAVLGGGLMWNMPFDLFKASVRASGGTEHAFTLRMDKIAQNKMNFVMNYHNYKNFDWSVSVRSYFDISRTREAVIEAIEQVPGVGKENYDNVSKWIAGHQDSPTFSAFADLVDRLRAGQITREEFENLLKGIVPPSDNRFVVKASQKITLFPLLVLGQYLNSILSVSASGGSRMGLAMASAYQLDLNNIDAYDFFQKLLDDQGTDFITRFLRLDYKKRYETIGHNLDDMNHIFERIYSLESSFDETYSSLFNFSVLWIKRNKTNHTRHDQLKVVDVNDDRNYFDITASDSDLQASIWGINATKDNKAMEVFSVVKYRTQDGHKPVEEKDFEDFAARVRMRIFEFKPSLDWFDTNRGSHKTRNEAMGYYWLLTNALEPTFVNQSVDFAGMLKKGNGYMNVELELTVTRDTVDRFLESPLWYEFQQSINSKDSCLEGHKAILKFMNDAEKLKFLAGAPRYKGFNDLLVRYSDALINIGALAHTLTTLVGNEAWKQTSLLRASLRYFEKGNKTTPIFVELENGYKGVARQSTSQLLGTVSSALRHLK